jgi:hypothetical protein
MEQFNGINIPMDEIAFLTPPNDPPEIMDWLE